MSWGTVDWIEVVWTLAAVPGLVLWFANRVTAGRSLKAVKLLKITDGRAIVARYSVEKSNILIGVQGVFALIGAISMLRPQNPEVAQWDWLRVILTIGLLGAPFALSYLGFRWRIVDQEIIRLARHRKKSPTPPTG